MTFCKKMKKNPPQINFSVCREYLDEEGIWNPKENEGYFDGALQISMYGTQEKYRELGEFFIRMSEEIGDDNHWHFEGNESILGNSRIHLILRSGEYPEFIEGEQNQSL